ncbi:FKBP12-associated protein [Coemansia sp. RSA 355]|nr:FKBP12-associated protein [Coemansia sp. RSA 355]
MPLENSSSSISLAGLTINDNHKPPCPPEAHPGAQSLIVQNAQVEGVPAEGTRAGGRSKSNNVTSGSRSKPPARSYKGNRSGKAPIGNQKNAKPGSVAGAAGPESAGPATGRESKQSVEKPAYYSNWAQSKPFVPKHKAKAVALERPESQTQPGKYPKIEHTSTGDFEDVVHTLCTDTMYDDVTDFHIKHDPCHYKIVINAHAKPDKEADFGKHKGKAIGKIKSQTRSNDYRGRKSGKSQAMVGGGRKFNGSLTANNEASDSDGGGGSTVRANSESQDLCSSLSKRLANSSYECMICCDKVRTRHAIWHCDKCWAIFHIGCVQKWVKSSAGDQSARWRCPGCQHERAAAPSHYVCFCGASLDPEPARGNTPHSCGQICGRNRGPHCVHACPLPCHPGPCPPCAAMAPEQWCFCGRQSHQPRCGADYDPVTCIQSCDAVCGEMLGCGRHACEQSCHAGLCQPCPHEEQQQCYCGQHTRMARCGDGQAMQTFVTRVVDGNKITAEETGYYDCGTICGEELGCGIHTCERSCHPHPRAGIVHGNCPLDPAVVKACHCQKKLASELGSPRRKCTDAVPSCGQQCERRLAGCLHTCKETCHAGPCPPCEIKISATCGCGSTKFQIECHKARGSELQCEKVCSKMRVCKRHQCSVRCCPSDHTDMSGVVVPSERIAPGVTDPHQCMLICGRKLRCKNHQCGELCHRGACPPCRSATFDELACSCGRTRLYPPIACGTALPPCHFPCQRTRECGHYSLITHECHPDSTPCPSCPVLVTAQCMCGGKEMKNIPCYRSHAASCGSICNKLLPCGGHRCQRSCHRADEPCLRGQPCKQVCKKPRKACGHPCSLACHSPAMCDESKPCDALVTMTCSCERMTAQQVCGATTATVRSPGLTRIACNEVCKIAERNRRLALALDIKDRADAPLAGLVRATYTDDLLQFSRTHISWVRDIEAMASAFIGDQNRATLHFAPMKQQFRAFLHALGPFYGCRSRSMDYEPLRSACWDRTAQATIPSISLSNAARYAQVPQMICSNQIHTADDSDFDDSASHDFDLPARVVSSVADRLRRKIDYLVISDLRHGLVEAELRTEIDKLISSAPYGLRWMGEDDVEMYCTDIEARNECLIKWEAMLKSKLPRLGVAGMVRGVRVAAKQSVLPKESSSFLSLNTKRPESSAAHDAPASLPESVAGSSDDNIPEDWESLNA